MLETTIIKIGNSNYANLPKKIVGYLGLKTGDKVLIDGLHKISGKKK